MPWLVLHNQTVLKIICLKAGAKPEVATNKPAEEQSGKKKIWSPVGDLKWAHARKSSNIQQHKKFCMKSGPNFHRAVPEHLWKVPSDVTGEVTFAQKNQSFISQIWIHRGDFKDDEMFANPNVSKKKKKQFPCDALLCHVNLNVSWNLVASGCVKLLSGDYCGGAVAVSQPAQRLKSKCKWFLRAATQHTRTPSEDTNLTSECLHSSFPSEPSSRFSLLSLADATKCTGSAQTGKTLTLSLTSKTWNWLHFRWW